MIAILNEIYPDLYVLLQIYEVICRHYTNLHAMSCIFNDF